MAKIRWTNEAVNWHHDIFEYISQDNPKATHRVIEGIYNKTQILSEYPKIGHIYRTEVEGEIRILLYGHYRITYLLKSDEIVEFLVFSMELWKLKDI